MADLQYIIDIAAELGKSGEATPKQLDEIAKKLTGAGDKSDTFNKAIKSLQQEFDIYQRSIDQANQVLGDQTKIYRVLERDAIKAAKALERAQLKGKVTPEIENQARLTAEALGIQSGRVRGAQRDLDDYVARQDVYAKKLAGIRNLSGQLSKRQADLVNKYDKVGAAASALGGPLGSSVATLAGGAKAATELGAAFGGVSAGALILAGGVVIAAVAVVALTAALVAGYIALQKYAAETANATREANLSREAFAALGKQTQAGVASFDAIQRETELSDERLVALTKSLKGAKVSAEQMPKALRAAALAETALGQGGADEFITSIKEGERSVDSFARTADRSFGGIVAKRMLGLEAQGKRFKRLFAGLFDNLKLEPVLKGFRTLVGMFDKANPLAQSMQLLFEKLFEPIAKHAQTAAYAIEAFALGFAIQLTKMYIAVKPAIRAIGELFGSSKDSNRLLNAMKNVGEIAAVMGVTFVALLGIAVAPMVLAFGVLTVALIGIGQIIKWVGEFVYFLIKAFTELGDNITVLRTLGAEFIDGFIMGIKDGFARAVEATKEVLGGVVKAAKDFLGISSPSKVMRFQVGHEIGEGVAEGQRDKIPEVRSSMADLVNPDPAIAAASSGASVDNSSTSSTSSSSRSVAISFDGATITFAGENDSDRLSKFREMLTRLLENDADSLTGAAT